MSGRFGAFIGGPGSSGSVGGDAARRERCRYGSTSRPSDRSGSGTSGADRAGRRLVPALLLGSIPSVGSGGKVSSVEARSEDAGEDEALGVQRSRSAADPGAAGPTGAGAAGWAAQADSEQLDRCHGSRPSGSSTSSHVTRPLVERTYCVFARVQRSQRHGERRS